MGAQPVPCQIRSSRPGRFIRREGDFRHITNQMQQEVGTNYWSRNIHIARSNTTVDGLTLQVAGETDVGHPYVGFLPASATTLTCKAPSSQGQSGINKPRVTEAPRKAGRERGVAMLRAATRASKLSTTRCACPYSN